MLFDKEMDFFELLSLVGKFFVASLISVGFPLIWLAQIAADQGKNINSTPHQIQLFFWKKMALNLS